MPERTPPLRVQVRWDRVVATVTVHGELDIATAPRLSQELLTVAAARPERLVLDLDCLVFLDVAGARALAAAHKALAAECPVILRSPTPGPQHAGVFGPREGQRGEGVVP